MKMNITKSGMLALLTLLVFGSVLTIGCIDGDGDQPSGTTEPGASGGTGEQNDSSRPESFSGSMQDLMALGSSIKCTFSGTDEGTEYSGVLYAAGKKARQDVEVIANGEKVETHVIVDDRWTYMWSSMNQHNGMKMYIDLTDEELRELGEEANNAYSDQEKEYNFQCLPWIVDSSKFVLPSDVEFTDLSEMMEGLQGSMPGMDNESGPAGASSPNVDEFDEDALNEFMCQNCDQMPNPAECKAEYC